MTIAFRIYKIARKRITIQEGLRYAKYFTIDSDSIGLLTLSLLVQAAGNNHADDSLNKDAIIPISYCYNGKKGSS